MKKGPIIIGFFIIAILLVSGCVKNDNETDEIKVNYSCISCITRDTKIKFYLSFGKDIEFNKIDIIVNYETRGSLEYYTCYPSKTEMENLKTIPPEESTEFWEKLKIKSSEFECYFESRNLKKPGTYKFLINVYKTGSKKTYRGDINISINESGLLPDFLKNKTIYNLGDVIKERPLKNMFIYKIEYKDVVKVRKCERSLSEIKNNCADLCIEKRISEELEECKNSCMESEIKKSCIIIDYKAPENNKFAVIHYGIAAEKNKIKKIGFSCPEVKNDIVSNLITLGYCAVPLTIDVSAEIVNSFLKSYSEIEPVITTLASFMIGFIGSTSYEISVIDEWDVDYEQYFPMNKKENGKTYYYYAYSPTGFTPYIYAIPEKEKIRFLIGKRVTSGLFLIIPVNKENIIFAVNLGKI